MLNTNGKNACVNGLAGVVTHVSVHSAEPDAAGSNELSGGTYARQAATWTTAASGVRDNNADLTHPIPAGSTVWGYGLFSASTAGTFYGGVPRVGPGETLAGVATCDAAGVTGDLLQSAAHGLSNGMQVMVYDIMALSLPAGLAEGTVYYVVGVTTNTFQLAATSGGSAINLTAQGVAFWQRVVVEVFASAGSLVTATGALDLSSAVI